MTDSRYDLLARLIIASPHNLVSARDREHVASLHIPEALAVSAVLNVEAGQRWMDLGTGGGLPGLPLAMVFSGTEWVLVDATVKKIKAVGEFVDALGLTHVTARAGRAEHLARDEGYRGTFDGVVARAVAPLATLAELSRGFLKPGGVLVAIKGPRWEEEIDLAGGGLRRMAYAAPKVREVAGAPRPTWVVILKADGHPPAALPRRDGLPKREPLR